MMLTKDGITVEVFDKNDIARLQHLGYKEVKDEPPVAVSTPEPPIEKAPEEKNAEAIAEVNKPSKKTKGGEK